MSPKGPKKRTPVFIPSLVGRVDPVVDKAIQETYKSIGDLQNKYREWMSMPPPLPDFSSISKELSANGKAPLNLQGLVGQLSTPQRAAVITTTTATGGITAQNGTLAVVNGVLSTFQATPLPGVWVPVTTIAAVLSGTHTLRLTTSPNTQAIGAIFWETDRKILYINLGTFGSSAWTYALGTMSGVLATKPTDLGTTDVGFLFYVTDYIHILQWTGTIWTWGPGDDGRAGEGPIFREIDPAPLTGWQIYDGSTVTYLKSDGTTGNVTLPNLTSIPGNAAFLQGGSPNSAVVPAVAATFLGTPMANHAHDSPVSDGVIGGVIYTMNVNGYGSTFLTTAAVVSTGGPFVAAALSTSANSAGTPTGTITGGTPQSLTRRAFFRR